MKTISLTLTKLHKLPIKFDYESIMLFTPEIIQELNIIHRNNDYYSTLNIAESIRILKDAGFIVLWKM